MELLRLHIYTKFYISMIKAFILSCFFKDYFIENHIQIFENNLLELIRKG